MTPSQIQKLADSIAHMLLSHACHGLATQSLEGRGEITLRDGLVVAAAAVGARTRRALILEREITPTTWTDASVDLMVYRTGNNNSKHLIGGVELKWWRQTDSQNAGNRRRDLLKDFLRAGALYPDCEAFSFVALLSTTGSWSVTAGTTGSDKPAMDILNKSGVQKWNMSRLNASAGVKAAMKYLDGKVPVCKIIHSDLLADHSIAIASGQAAFARVWSVKKPQKAKLLTSADITELVE